MNLNAIFLAFYLFPSFFSMLLLLIFVWEQYGINL